MINKFAVFILGAGASQPYGFPTGQGLKDRIVSQFRKVDSSPYWDWLERHSVQKSWAEKFAHAFARSGKKTIDSFLAEYPNGTPAGKALISLVIQPCENENQLIYGPGDIPIDGKPPGDWYLELIQRMSPIKDFEHNQVAFITFNYDRSLEHRLILAIQNSLGIDVKEAYEKFSKIPVVHIHGVIAPLHNPVQIQGMPYGIEPSHEVIQAGINNILDITTDKEKVERNYQTARSLIKKADRIYVLGFGFDPQMAIRLFDDSEIKGRKRIDATSRGLSIARIKEMEKLIPSLKFFEKTWDCRQFFEETVV